MKLERVVIENYRGKSFDFVPGRVNLFFDENGSGKTSLCDAIRYGITGLIPKDDVRNTAVKIWYGNGLEAERSRAQRTSCRIGGGKVTEAEFNSEIMKAVKNSLDDIKVVSSTEVLSNLRPGDLLNLLLKYVPEQLDFNTVMHYFNNLTDEIVDECSLIFPSMPEKFDIAQIQEAYEYFFAERRSQKALLQQREGYLNGLHAEEPSRTLEIIDQDIADLIIKEKEVASLNKKMREYNVASKKREFQERQIKVLEQQIKDLGDVKAPDENILKTLEKKRTVAESEKLKASNYLATVGNNIQLFERTLGGLETTHCPISDRLTCTTDKTAVRAEMVRLLEENRTLQSAMEKKLKEQEVILTDCATDIQKYNAAKHTYDTFLRYQSNIKVYKENLAIVPEKPEEAIDSEAIAAKKNALLAEKKNCKDYQTKSDTQKEVDELRRKAGVYDYIVAALADKGEVKNAILSYYLSMFSDTCNLCAKAFAPGYELQFVADDGVKVIAKTPKCSTFVNLISLSNGERIIATLIMLDMLNQLSGANLLFIDNVEALDEENLKSLRRLIENKDFQDRYDHIFICGVNHASVAAVFKGMDAKFL